MRTSNAHEMSEMSCVFKNISVWEGWAKGCLMQFMLVSRPNKMRPRGKARRRWLDRIKEINEEEADYRDRWKDLVETTKCVLWKQGEKKMSKTTTRLS